ncbi:type II toxin-antitoxin system Phd/YefM family antitoxin [Actinomadura sp. GTD37]|uniref:type II toxin-antitoxin system Phd/YefM family antitoxin n=1 Tax=Actinomadura sp. GTD37 TaxID=1778030 RepID=UPI0035BFEEB9
MTEARAEFADLVNRVAYTGEPVKLTRRGKVMAALVSPEDLELLEAIRAQRPDLQVGGTVPPGQPSRPAERPSRGPAAPSPPMRIAAEYRPPGFSR